MRHSSTQRERSLELRSRDGRTACPKSKCRQAKGAAALSGRPGLVSADRALDALTTRSWRYFRHSNRENRPRRVWCDGVPDSSDPVRRVRPDGCGGWVCSAAPRLGATAGSIPARVQVRPGAGRAGPGSREGCPAVIQGHPPRASDPGRRGMADQYPMRPGMKRFVEGARTGRARGTPERLRRCWGRGHSRDCEIDFRPGGRYRFASRQQVPFFLRGPSHG
jgi:hypothetical protein